MKDLANLVVFKQRVLPGLEEQNKWKPKLTVYNVEENYAKRGAIRSRMTIKTKPCDVLYLDFT